MLYAILDPATENASVVPASIRDGHDLTGKTVIEVEDGFNWSSYKRVDWGTLTIVEDLERARAEHWQAIKADRDARLETAETTFGIFQSDDRSLTFINGKVSKLLRPNDNTTNVTWRMADNTFETLSKADFIAAATEIEAHVEGTMQAGWMLENAINTATTVADIFAVAWSD